MLPFVGFIPRNRVRRPRPVGRPPAEIPAQLRQILDETFSTNSAWQERAEDTDPSDLREVIRLGELYARRRGLSFRHRLADDDDGVRTFSMWLTTKNSYHRTAS